MPGTTSAPVAKIPRNHGNLDIILIPEARSVALFTLNNPQGKRAQARAR
jgi:hypothetical protein